MVKLSIDRMGRSMCGLSTQVLALKKSGKCSFATEVPRREAVLGRARSRNIADFGRESRNLSRAQSKHTLFN